MGHKLMFLTQYDESGASSRIRIYQFLRPFQKAGFQVTVRPLIRGNANQIFRAFAVAKNPFSLLPTLFSIFLKFGNRVRDVIEAWSFYAVIVQKDVMPFGLRSLLKWRQKNIIFEFDDPIWLSHPSSGNVWLLGRLISGYRKRLLIEMLRCAKLVIVDNSYLRDFAAPYAKEILILTSPVDTRSYPVIRKKPGQEPTFGWIGSPSSTYLLKEMMPLLERLAGEIAFSLYNIGGLPLNSNYFKIHNIEWSLENELNYLAKMDVGLMPTDDRPFNLLRFGYKIVLYFSTGIPTLGTDVGLNRVAITPEMTGLLYSPQNPDDFVRKAKRLLGDGELRKRLGQNSRLEAERVYDLALLAQKFIDAVQGVVGRVEPRLAA